VLTPHPGEAARLLGLSVGAIQSDRLAAARRLAAASGAVVVLKGHRTVIATPGGDASINASGNPGMATAGSGDVLTGIVGALLARGLGPVDASRIAVFAHGDAGDRAAARKGQEGMIAADLLEELPAALVAIGSAGDRKTW
jgi:NAD(P)H-hydrate epimerase